MVVLGTDSIQQSYSMSHTVWVILYDSNCMGYSRAQISKMTLKVEKMRIFRYNDKHRRNIHWVGEWWSLKWGDPSRLLFRSNSVWRSIETTKIEKTHPTLCHFHFLIVNYESKQVIVCCAILLLTLIVIVHKSEFPFA